jgi:hypothetical protein
LEEPRVEGRRRKQGLILDFGIWGESEMRAGSGAGVGAGGREKRRERESLSLVWIRRD